VTLTGVSGSVTSSDINSDGISDLLTADADGNSHVIYGRADLLSAPAPSSSTSATVP
jgi:hypothetical protein